MVGDLDPAPTEVDLGRVGRIAAEVLRMERVKHEPAIFADLDEPRPAQDAEVVRNVDDFIFQEPGYFGDVLTPDPQQINDANAIRFAEGLEQPGAVMAVFSSVMEVTPAGKSDIDLIECDVCMVSTEFRH